MRGKGNVMSYLEAACARVPDRAALIGPDGEEWSFLELDARVDWMMTGLRAEGIEAGDRVIVMAPMSLRLYQVLLAVLKLGAVAVFVDPWVGVKQIAKFSAYAEPKGFVGVGKSHLVRLFEKELRVLPVTVTTGGRFFSIPARRTLEEVECYQGRQKIVERRPDDTALITFTSGSSGRPKGADRTHLFLSAQHEALKAAFPYEEGEVDLPMFPVFSLNNLAQGLTTVIPDMDFRDVAGVEGSRILEQIEAHGVRTVTASPPFFDQLARAIQARGAGAPRLRRILTGGAPVSDEQLRRWREAFEETEILVVYGSTEAEPVAHVEAGERLELMEKAGPGKGYCVGRPVEAVKTKVIAITGEPVVLDEKGWAKWEMGAGEVGELLVSGAHVCDRYFRNPIATAENKIIEDDGRVWHRMGDTGYFDGAGRFWLTGRVHSTIRRRGVLYQAQAVEQIARGEESRILQVAAVGVGGEEREERLILVIRGSGEPGMLLEEVKARLEKEGIECDQVLWRSKPLPVDPRHHSKIDYRRLREELEIEQLELKISSMNEG